MTGQLARAVWHEVYYPILKHGLSIVYIGDNSRCKGALALSYSTHHRHKTPCKEGCDDAVHIHFSAFKVRGRGGDVGVPVGWSDPLEHMGGEEYGHIVSLILRQ